MKIKQELKEIVSSIEIDGFIILVGLFTLIISLCFIESYSKYKVAEVLDENKYLCNEMVKLEEEIQVKDNIISEYQNEMDDLEEDVEQLNKDIETLNKINTNLCEKLTKRESSNPDDIKQLIYDVAVTYGVDPHLAIAIARLETGNFTSTASVNYHNYGGLMGSNGLLRYDSVVTGVVSYIEILKNGYISVGLTTPETMQPKYCPNSTTWAPLVRALMKEEEDNDYIK